MLTFQGYPRDGGCYVGYSVILNGQVVGTIGVCGDFNNNVKAVFTEEEKLILRDMSKKVYEMPSEWGVLGVGDSPSEPFDKFVSKHPSWFLF